MSAHFLLRGEVALGVGEGEALVDRGGLVRWRRSDAERLVGNRWSV